MITIKTAPVLAGYSVLQQTSYNGWVAVAWFDHDGVTVRTCEGYLSQGFNTRCGDREVTNAQIDGEFYSCRSFEPVAPNEAVAPNQVWIHFKDGWTLATWIDSRVFVTGRPVTVYLGRRRWPGGVTDEDCYEHFRYVRHNSRYVFYKCYESTSSKCDEGYLDRRTTISARKYSQKLYDRSRVSESGIPGLTFRHLSEYTASSIEYYLRTGLPVPDGWGDLDMRAVQGTRAININTLMYIKELTEMGKMVKSTIDSAISLYTGNWQNALKESANLYLSYHYGYRLSYKDTCELYNVARREINSVKRSMAATRESKTLHAYYPDVAPLAGLNGTYTRSVKIWYRQFPQQIAQLVNGLFRWDVFPELGNIYDLIPYSFVVDWFLPIGDLLDVIDTHTYASSLDVLGVMRSEKLSCDCVPPGHSLVRMLVGECTPLSPVSFRFYRRFWEEEISYPPLQLSFQSGPKNWLPAGAMILQRI